MAVAGAALGEDGQDLALVQLNGLRGGQIVGAEDHGAVSLDAAFHYTHEVVENAPGHVPDIGSPGPHIGVVHLGQHGGELLPGLLHGILRAAAGVQHLFHHRGIVLVLHEHGVGLK